ncbi:unnamed protein product [Rotaria sp. Silwood1]|nr:unnamed protein product [Rotaria sp. Silwood1]
MHAYTVYGFLRPFGCFILLAAYESDELQLYGFEPSGVTYSYYGIAVDKAQKTAKTIFEKLKLPVLNLEYTVKQAAKM